MQAAQLVSFQDLMQQKAARSEFKKTNAALVRGMSAAGEYSPTSWILTAWVWRCW